MQESMRGTIGGKDVAVYSIGSAAAGASLPIVYLNMYTDMGSAMSAMLAKRDLPPFNLAAICALEWDNDMCPWACPPLSKDDTPCTGGADGYLALLTQQIIPWAEGAAGVPSWRGIAGYSLGGLFALYAPYKTDAFHRVASMSGSLWYPRFAEYAMQTPLKRRPECVYFSLGDKEKNARNKHLKCVQEKTEALHSFYQSAGIETEFHLNSGGHFEGGAERTALGIEWILRH